MRWTAIRATLLVLGISATTRAHFADEQIYIIDAFSGEVWFVNPDTWIGTPVFGPPQGLSGPAALTFDYETDMLVTNETGNDVTIVYGNSSTGNPVMEPEDGIDSPTSIALDGYGWIYVGSSSKSCRTASRSTTSSSSTTRSC